MATPVEEVTLVDAHGRPIGSMEKLEAHRRGLLHSAFSIFVFDRQGRLLIQQRAASKYHSPGLWSNTACGHPRPGETVAGAALRRLKEEMGFSCDLEPRFQFQYRCQFTDGLVENEHDHVLTGRFDGEPQPDPAEVQAWRWVDPSELEREIRHDPAAFTFWVMECLGRVLALA